MNDHGPHLLFPSPAILFLSLLALLLLKLLKSASPLSCCCRAEHCCCGFIFFLPQTRGEHVRTLKCCKKRKEKKRERKGHNCAEQLSIIPPNLFPFLTCEAGGLLGKELCKWVVPPQWWRVAVVAEVTLACIHF